MKKSNILILVAFAWLLAFMAYDKFLIKQNYLKINTNVKFGEFTHKKELNFRHVHVSGGNKALVRIDRGGISGLRSRENFKGSFTYRVENDTLYVHFNKEFTEDYKVKPAFYNKLIICHDKPESITVHKSHVSLFAYNRDKVDLHIDSFSRLTAYVNNIKNFKLDVSESSSIVFKGKKKMNIDSLQLRIQSNSHVDIKDVNYKYLDTIEVSTNSKLMNFIKK